MNQLQTIQKNLPCSKDEIQLLVDTVIDQVINNETDPLEIAPALKIMEDIVKGIRGDKDVKNTMIGMIEEQGKNVKIGNATISIVDTTRYDYTQDLVWLQLDREGKKIAQKKKAREEVLRSVTSEFEDPINNGVILKPLKKTISQTIRVTL